MKYPQLVSARAVNAISDWLVSRLERLGVDAPLVYSRLLLSLLHKPLQINALDLADIPAQLKLKGGGCLGSRKNGGGHRLTQNEAETLKRFAAVESLMDVTASDQLKTEVEDLVDELCEKLREIERQQNSLESEENLVDTTIIDQHEKATELITSPSLLDNKLSKEERTFTTNSKYKPLKSSSDTDKRRSPDPEDPRKKYYRAFPSLSKEDNNRESNTSKMPLTWPSGSSSTTKIGSNKNTITGIGSCSKAISASSNNVNAASSNTAGVKRKQKRRRNNNHHNTTNLHHSSHPHHHHQGKNFNRNKNLLIMATEDESSIEEKTSSLWDTNFEGTWEMGHDLIRDFILKQNKRNRCFSENNACSQYNSHDDEFDQRNNTSIKIDLLQQQDDEEVELISPSVDQASRSLSTKQTIDDYNEGATPETFASFGGGDISDQNNPISPYSMKSTITASQNNSLLLPEPPRRLYEREISNESIDNSDSENFALFEAKFNSSVEALWDDKDPKEAAQPLPVTLSHTTRNDLNLFWSNYYKHQYKPSAAANDYSLDLVSGVLSSPSSSSQRTSNYNSLNKKHDFIESGTNLQSSIWSNNPDNSNFESTELGNNVDIGGSRAVGNGGFYAIDLWGKITANTKNENLTNHLGGSYSIENFSKWSDCSYEDPFIPSQQNQAKSLNAAAAAGDAHQSNQNFDYRSLPTTTPNVAAPNSIRQEKQEDEQSMSSVKLMNSNKKVCNKVTLANHSETSGFTKVYPKTTNFYNYYDRQYRNSLDTNKKRYSQESALNDDENLLISDRTHFRPIKQTYVDGYTFDIPCNLDEVKYTRSESGALYFESEKYVEYKFQADNANFLDTKRNSKRNCGGCNDNFTLKYCVRQVEKCCQTDDTPQFGRSADGFLEVVRNQNVNRVIGGENSLRKQLQQQQLQQQQQLNKLDFELDIEMELQREQTRILNYCICYEQKYDLDDSNSGSVVGSSLLHHRHHNSVTVSLNDSNNNCNPICSVHPLANDEIENWSLNKIKNSCINNNHSNHTLWGHCTSCNNDIKSMPANRLLKDELLADGDEIMSDLKYMQNLFIGTDWNSADGGEPIDAGDDHTNDENLSSILIRHSDDDDDDDEDNHHRGRGHHIENYDDVDNDDDDDDVDEIYHLQHITNNNNNDLSIDNKNYKAGGGGGDDVDDDDENEEMYNCNINKLISDLLKPETAKSITQILGPSQGKTILEEIAMNEERQQQQKQQSDWCYYKNIFSNGLTTSSNINNNNNNNIINNNNNYITSGDEIFGGLWKKFDNNNIIGGDWSNCKNLKSIIENQNEDDYDEDIYHNLNRVNTKKQQQQQHFEIIAAASAVATAHHTNQSPAVPICFDILDSDHDNFYHDPYGARHITTSSLSSSSVINKIKCNTINDTNSNNINNNNNNVNNNKNTTGLLAMVMDNSTNNNDNINSISLNIKRGDRKRRHSAASQNLQNDDVLVHGKFSINTNDQYDVTATVITCAGYWTTTASDAKILPKFELGGGMMDGHGGGGGDVGINPSSILKHVTMVSRPLTR